MPKPTRAWNSWTAEVEQELWLTDWRFNLRSALRKLNVKLINQYLFKIDDASTFKRGARRGGGGQMLSNTRNRPPAARIRISPK